MSKYLCPKCGGEIEDCSAGDEWGWFEDEPFRCAGHYTGRFPNVSRDCSLNRTKSCGWFKLEELKKCGGYCG
ncbi:hypothetical protein [Rodentibacter caecimuris]|uniref:hypothetical protein n=1 Tax=Rodentibacter caecimuris TaxID=1796644 RepID=UPI0013A083F3|nr:hypothetical protein [Rodentibacter heylii]QIA76153.1 hypothetical protein FEE42_01660 [Rodentibacter heylii]